MSYQIIFILILYVLLANIIWPSIVSAGRFNTRVINYMKANNITSPSCFTKYVVKVSQSIFRLNVEIGINSDGIFTPCEVIPSQYIQCTASNYADALHPCSFVRSTFRTFVI